MRAWGKSLTSVVLSTRALKASKSQSSSLSQVWAPAPGSSPRRAPRPWARRWVAYRFSSRYLLSNASGSGVMTSRTRLARSAQARMNWRNVRKVGP